jgi:tetratricopeptide (TPR) repeat protein
VTVGTAEGGQVTGVNIHRAAGDVSIRSTVNQILVLNDPHALHEILKNLMMAQGVDENAVKSPGTQKVPRHVHRQITGVMTVQKELAARGMSATPQALYRLGMLAAFDRNYESALGYFRQATEADPEYTEAFKAIAWLQQGLAVFDINTQQYEAAQAKLSEARAAAAQTDPLDAEALALRGFIVKTLAQVAEATQDPAGRAKYNREAERFFKHVLRLEPDNASAHNGLGNVHYALGNLNAAIASYQRAIQRAAAYAEAHHDLSLAFEGKMQTDPNHADRWGRKALAEWRTTYQLALNHPIFPVDHLLAIGQRIAWLEAQYGRRRPGT